MQPRKPNSKYACLDVDQTMVDGHLHNTIFTKMGLNTLIRKIKTLEAQIEDENSALDRCRYMQTEEGAAKELASTQEKIEILDGLINDTGMPFSKEDLDDLKAERKKLNDMTILKIMEEAKQQLETPSTVIQDLEAKIAALREEYQQKLNDTDAQWECVKHLKPLGTKEEWQEIFTQGRKNGFEFSALSYSLFPKIIQRFLEEKLGFKCQILEKDNQQQKVDLDPDKFTIIAYLPPDLLQKRVGKNHHILQYLKANGVSTEKDIASRVIFVDDSKINRDRAEEENYTTVIAIPKDTMHLKKLLKLIQASSPKLSVVGKFKPEDKTDTGGENSNPPPKNIIK